MTSVRGSSDDSRGKRRPSNRCCTMLRLKPSELTLTAADIEETYRRMARRQPAAPTASLPIRTARPQHQPPSRPRLRRGPEQSRDDAITSLGNIPILTPHQVIHASVEDDDEDNQLQRGNATRPEEAGQAAAVNELPSFRSEQALPAHRQGPAPARSSPTDPQQPSSRSSAREARSSVCSDSTENAEEEASPSPPKQQVETSGLGRAGAEAAEAAEEVFFASQLSTTIDGAVEASNRSHIPCASQNPSHRRHVSNSLSPTRHPRAIGSRRSQETLQIAPSRDETPQERNTTRYLQGYFQSPHQYTFREYVPRTEPGYRHRRATPLVRTFSSSSDPAHSRLVQRPDRTDSSATEDVFWTAPAPEPPLLPQHHSSQSDDEFEQEDWHTPLGTSTDIPPNESLGNIYPYQERHGRGRQDPPAHSGRTSNLRVNPHLAQRFSSEASNSSFAYSVYELPDSRHSSQGDQLPQSQYDGAAPSTNFSRGAYYSIRPSQLHGEDDSHPRPAVSQRTSSHSSPNLTVLGQHNISPLPSSPYARVQSTLNPPRHATILLNENDFVGAGEDASSAAARDLSSPLDLVEQRATSYLNQMSEAQRRRAYETYAAVPSVFQYQVEDFNAPRPRQRRPSMPDSVRNVPNHSARGRNPTGRGFWNGRMPQQPYRHSERPPMTQIPGPRPHRRPLPAARAGQRSSENVPVGYVHEGRPAVRNAQGQGQRVSVGHIPQGTRSASLRGGDTIGPSIPVRFSLPQGSSPQDVSNRPRSSPYQPHMGFAPQDRDPVFTRFAPPEEERHDGRAVPGSVRGPPIPPRLGSRQHDSDFPHHQPTHLAGNNPHLYPERQIRHMPAFQPPVDHRPVAPVTAFEHVSGLTSRRPPLPRIATSRRRLPPHQQNQENSGDAEAELMREEMDVAGMRYAEGAQMDVMDETPPRIGRFERHMLD